MVKKEKTREGFLRGRSNFEDREVGDTRKHAA